MSAEEGRRGDGSRRADRREALAPPLTPRWAGRLRSSPRRAPTCRPRRGALPATPGSRRCRAMRASALRWSAPAPSGASSRKIEVDRLVVERLEVDRLRRAARTGRRCGRGLASLPCGMAMPPPTPVEPSFSRWSSVSKISRSGEAGELGRLLGDRLDRLLLAVGLQRADHGLRLDEIAQVHHRQSKPCPLGAGHLAAGALCSTIRCGSRLLSSDGSIQPIWPSLRR